MQHSGTLQRGLGLADRVLHAGVQREPRAGVPDEFCDDLSGGRPVQIQRPAWDSADLRGAVLCAVRSKVRHAGLAAACSQWD